jgi:hypothetical protein
MCAQPVNMTNIPHPTNFNLRFMLNFLNVEAWDQPDASRPDNPSHKDNNLPDYCSNTSSRLETVAASLAEPVALYTPADWMALLQPRADNTGSMDRSNTSVGTPAAQSTSQTADNYDSHETRRPSDLHDDGGDRPGHCHSLKSNLPTAMKKYVFSF